MNRFRPSVRRVLAFAGAAFVGAAASLALAAPASAHFTVITGSPHCDTVTGEWVIAWSVESHNTPPEATQFRLIQVTVAPGGSTLTGLPLNVDQSVAQPFTGEQRVAGNETSATLSVRARWNNNFQEESHSKTVDFGGPCEQDQPKPNAAFASACDGTVTVTLTNADDAKAPAAFTVAGEAGFSQKATVEPGGSKEIVVPAEAAGHITVTVGDKKLAEHAWQEPEDCAPVKVASRSDCDSLTVSVENPAGSRPVQATVTSGDKTETLTLAPGETKEVTFEAEEGTVAIVTIGDESLDVAWEQPEGCVPAGPGLPVTGASIGGVIAIGLALVVAGAGLLVLFRRRRGTFAA